MTMEQPVRRKRQYGSGEVFQDGRGWVIRWREDGRRRSRAGLPSREIAERLLAKVLGEVAQGVPSSPTFSQIAVVPVRPVSGVPAELPAPLSDVARLVREAWFGMGSAPGIYFLLKAGAVVYVGQSACVRRRLGQHLAAMDFDRALWIQLERGMLDVAEACLIALFRPALNKDLFDLTPQRARWLEGLGFRPGKRDLRGTSNATDAPSMKEEKHAV
jgi:hypothetical protein